MIDTNVDTNAYTKPVRAKIVLDIEARVCGNGSDVDTLIFFVKEDLDDAGGYEIHSITEVK